MKTKLIIFFLLALGLASCSSSVHDDYREVDKGIVVCTDSLNSRIAIRHADSTLCLYSLKHRYDDMSRFAGEYTRKIQDNDTVYIYSKGMDFVASRLDIIQAQKVNNFLNDYNFHLFYGWKNLLILLGLFIVICFVASFLFVMLGKGAAEFAIFVIVISWMFAFVIHTGVFADIGLDHKLIPECSGKIVKIEANTAWLEGDQVFRFASDEDIITNTPVQTGQKVYAYRYVNNSNHRGNRIFLSSEELSAQTLKSSDSYPELFWKTCGTFVLLFIISIFASLKITREDTN